MHQVIEKISLLAVLSIYLILAACGGGGGGAPIPTATPPAGLLSISIFEAPTIIPTNTTKQYSVVGYYAEGPSVSYPASYITWSSSAPNIATINEYGVATAGMNNGSANITATYGGQSATVLLTVKTPVSLTVTTLNGQAATLPLSINPLWLDASMNFSDGTSQIVNNTAVWSSSDTSVGKIWNNNGVTPVGVGTTTITVTDYGFTGTLDVTFTPPPVPTSISINGLKSSSGRYAKRTQMQLSATVSYSSGPSAAATNPIWSSSDTNVFTVDASGLLVGVGGGTALVTVTANGLSNSQIITMVNPTATPSVIVNCDASNPMTLSAATWNSNYAVDPTNTTEWVTVDAAACSPFPYVVLVITAVPTTTQYSILQAPRYSASVFGPAVTSTSTLTPQLSSGATVTVGMKPTEASNYYAPVYSITTQ